MTAKRLTPLWGHPFSELFASGDDGDARRLLLCFLHDGIASSPAALARVAAGLKTIAATGSEFIHPILTTRRIRDGRVVLAGDLVKGTALCDALGQGAFAPARAIVVTRQICHGLDAAHRRGMTHGLLSTGGVVLSRRDGRDDAVKLLDFGLAEEISLSELGARNAPWQPISPGLVAGDLATPARDVYLVGSILYAMLSGRAVFRGRPDQVRDGHAHGTPPCPDAPDALQSIVKRCLEKEPSRRYADMRELDAALRAAQETLSITTAWDALGPVRSKSTAGNSVTPPRRARQAEIPSGPYEIVHRPAADEALAERSDAVAADKVRRELRRSIGAGALTRGPHRSGPRLANHTPADTGTPPRVPPPPTIDTSANKPRRNTLEGKAASPPAVRKPEPTTTAKSHDATDHDEFASATEQPENTHNHDAEDSGTDTDFVSSTDDDDDDPVPAATEPAVTDAPTAYAPAPQTTAPSRWRLWALGAAAASVVALIALRADGPPSEARAAAPKASHVVAASAAKPMDEAKLVTQVGPVPVPVPRPVAPPPEVEIVVDEDPDEEPAADAPPLAPAAAVQPAGETALAGAASRNARARDAARRGKRALGRGDSQAAEQLLRQSLALNAKQPGVAFGLGKIRFNAGDYAGAATFFNRAARGSPRRGDYQLWLGDALFRQKKHAAARTHYAKAKTLGHAKAAGRLAKLKGK